MKKIYKTIATFGFIILIMAVWGANPVESYDCTLQGSTVSDNQVLYATRWNTEWTNMYSCAQGILTTLGTSDNTLASTDNAIGNRVTVLESATSGYVRITGSTMTGTLNMSSADITLSSSRTVDGVDVSALSALVSVINDGTLGSSIESTEITNGTIVAGDLADDAVTTTKILDGAIVAADIASNVITDNNLANGSVGTLEIMDGALLAEDFATGVLTTTQISDNSVTTNDILDATITYNDIASGTIRNSEIASNVITDNNLANGAVGTLEVANDALTGADINESTLDFSAAAIDDNDLANGSVGSLEVIDNSLTDNDLANGSVGTLEVSDNSIKGVDVDESSLTGFGTATFSGNVAIGSATTIYADSTSTFGGNITMPSTNKFFLDGGSDSYFVHPSDNKIQMWLGGITSFEATTSYLDIGTNINLHSNKNLYLDGGSDTYITSDNNMISFYANGTKRFAIDGSGGVNHFTNGQWVVLDSEARLYFDGGGNTYLKSSSSGDDVSLVTSGTERFKVDSSGHVFMPGLGTYDASNDFPVYYDSSTKEITANTSSRRYKEDIADVSDNDSARIYDLRPVTYFYKHADPIKRQRDIGLIAEEVEQVIPEMVGYNEDNVPEGVAYQKLQILLLAEIQKLKAQVDEMRIEMENLKASTQDSSHTESQ